MVQQWGIEANPDKFRAVLGMKSPSTIKKVQSLATERCKPFFKALKARKKLQWTAECEETFQKLKEYLVNSLLLAKPKPGVVLLLYFTISEHATSSVLLREDEDGVQ